MKHSGKNSKLSGGLLNMNWETSISVMCRTSLRTWKKILAVCGNIFVANAWRIVACLYTQNPGCPTCHRQRKSMGSCWSIQVSFHQGELEWGTLRSHQITNCCWHNCVYWRRAQITQRTENQQSKRPRWNLPQNASWNSWGNRTNIARYLPAVFGLWWVTRGLAVIANITALFKKGDKGSSIQLQTCLPDRRM